MITELLTFIRIVGFLSLAYVWCTCYKDKGVRNRSSNSCKIYVIRKGVCNGSNVWDGGDSSCITVVVIVVAYNACYALQKLLLHGTQSITIKQRMVSGLCITSVIRCVQCIIRYTETWNSLYFQYSWTVEYVSLYWDCVMYNCKLSYTTTVSNISSGDSQSLVYIWSVSLVYVHVLTDWASCDISSTNTQQ